jgi:hypothetical protein
MGGKATKIWVLPVFSKLEHIGGSGGAPVMWLLLWWSCLPKIYRGGPAYAQIHGRIKLRTLCGVTSIDATCASKNTVQGVQG